MFTDDWDSRNNLKVGDKIDCLDKFMHWQKAKIEHVKELNEKDATGAVLKEYIVGFVNEDGKLGLKSYE